MFCSVGRDSQTQVGVNLARWSASTLSIPGNNICAGGAPIKLQSELLCCGSFFTLLDEDRRTSSHGLSGNLEAN